MRFVELLHNVKQRIAYQINLFLIIAIANFCFIGAWSIYSQVHTEKKLAIIDQSVELTSGDVFELARLVAAIRLDLTQVQQFLQDVSATRAQNGLDSGFKEAEAFAKAFENDTLFAREIAQRLNRPDIVAAIDKVRKNFPAYYAMGIKMSKAYVAAGPEGGNPMMPVFDGQKDAMDASMAPLLQLVSQYLDKNNSDLKVLIKDVISIRHKADIISSVGLIMMIIACIGGGIAVHKWITKPMSDLALSMRSDAREMNGREVVTPCRDRLDELGDIARAFERFKNDILRTHEDISIEREQRDHERSRLVEKLAEATRHTANNADLIAAATAQLHHSITEIRNSTSASSLKTTRAVADVEIADKSIAQLSSAATKISSFIETISNIASQTNLLALNATIEAARAGDSGKGFAVVAHEVKALASQSSLAADEITLQVEAIQTLVENVLSSIRTMNMTVIEVNGIGATVASAITQQEAATQEIHRNVRALAESTQQLTLAVDNVSARSHGEALESSSKGGIKDLIAA